MRLMSKGVCGRCCAIGKLKDGNSFDRCRSAAVWNIDVIENTGGVVETIIAALLQLPMENHAPHPPVASATGPSLSPLKRGAVCLGPKLAGPQPVVAVKPQNPRKIVASQGLKG